jgi:hypothetical protein
MNLQESIRNDLNKIAEVEDSNVERYYAVYVFGELVSDTFGHLTKDEAMELVDEYELEGYDLQDIDMREVNEVNEVNEESSEYQILVRETHENVINVTASSLEEAKQKAIDIVKNGGEELEYMGYSSKLYDE